MANDVAKRDANNVPTLVGVDSSNGEVRLVEVTPTGELAVSGTITSAPSSGALTDRSGTITTGATAQQLMAANASRKYLFIRNPLNGAGRLWFNFTTTAVQDSPSIALDPGDSFVMECGFVSTEAISIIHPTTGAKFTAKEG